MSCNCIVGWGLKEGVDHSCESHCGVCAYEGNDLGERVSTAGLALIKTARGTVFNKNTNTTTTSTMLLDGRN